MENRLLIGGIAAAATGISLLSAQASHAQTNGIGSEVSVAHHLVNGEEFTLSPADLVRAGRALFTARWTSQEGQGRPLTKGSGLPVSDTASPLVFPNNFNRVSGPDTGACSKCHNTPLVGGGGDIVKNVFVLGERFDYATFDPRDAVPTRGALDETGTPVTLQNVANSRRTVGMFGSGFVEMLARQMTAELQEAARTCERGATCQLRAKNIDFGSIRHAPDGTWDTALVTGMPSESLVSVAQEPPSLIIRPLHQDGAVVSLREFTNGAFNQHHGIQSEERFGTADPDGDGYTSELTRADVTAVTIFQATLPVPGRVIPSHPAVRAAIRRGEQLFDEIKCTGCHVADLPLADGGWIFSEPNPFNPPENLRRVDGVGVLEIDLSSSELPLPRLATRDGVVRVPAYTDLKLHDITSGAPSCAARLRQPDCDGDVEPLNSHAEVGTESMYAGNSRFMTRKLWGIANQHSFGHHGQYTTMREAVLAHQGEARESRQAFEAIAAEDADAIIEFLKSLQILRPGTPCRVVDEQYQCTDYEGEVTP